MKKFLLSGLILILLTPAFAQAITVDELRTQIQTLQTQLQNLIIATTDTATSNATTADKPKLNIAVVGPQSCGGILAICTPYSGTLMFGQSIQLGWYSEGADSCAASGDFSGPLDKAGGKTLSPKFSSSYTITCTNAAGSTSQTAYVNVVGGPAATVNSNVYLVVGIANTGIPNSPGTFASRPRIHYAWSSTNAEACEFTSPFASGARPNGAETIGSDHPYYPPSSGQTWAIQCRKLVGNTLTNEVVSASVNFRFDDEPAAEADPKVTLNASPTTITSGQSSTLRFKTDNFKAGHTVTCPITGGSHTLSDPSTAIASPVETTIYTVICSNNAGQIAKDSATVTVTNSPRTTTDTTLRTQPTTPTYIAPTQTVTPAATTQTQTQTQIRSQTQTTTVVASKVPQIVIHAEPTIVTSFAPYSTITAYATNVGKCTLSSPTLRSSMPQYTEQGVNNGYEVTSYYWYPSEQIRSNTTYTATCTSTDGTQSASASVTVYFADFSEGNESNAYSALYNILNQLKKALGN